MTREQHSPENTQITDENVAENNHTPGEPRVAIVHDWLTNMGGAERVVLSLLKLYPNAVIFTSVYDPSKFPMLEEVEVRTTYLQKLPFKFKHALFAPLRPRAFRKLDMSEFDLVLTSSSAESKHVPVHPDATHIVYCHTPIRYYWSHYDEYKENPGFGWLNPLVRLALPLFVKMMRRTDYAAAQKPDYFIANSSAVQDRIKKFYNRKSVVIHPPVEVKRFLPEGSPKRQGFLMSGRQVPYKRFNLGVQAATELGDGLTVIGRGPDHKKLVEMAGPNVRFLTDVADDEIGQHFQEAAGFIFPGEEDFGISPVEAMAAGTPVIAFDKGGARDYIQPDKTGMLFKTQSVQGLKNAMVNFRERRFNHRLITEHAKQFDEDRFALEIKEFVQGVQKNT